MKETEWDTTKSAWGGRNGVQYDRLTELAVPYGPTYAQTKHN